MQISNKKVWNTKNLEAGIFLLMGTAKTVYDYRRVDEKYKRKILVNDVALLGASSVGMLSYHALCNNKTVRNKVFKPMVDSFDRFIPKNNTASTTKNIIASTLSNTAMVASGLFGAILGDYALSKTGNGIHKIENKKKDDLESPVQIQKVENFMHKNVDNVVSKRVQDEMFWRMTDFKAFDVFSSGFVGLASLDITNEEKYSKQVKNASKYLMLNTFVPLFFFSLSSALTKNLKTVYRIPIMFTSLVAATLGVKKAVDRKNS